MARRFRLWDPETVVNVADAHFTREQESEDPQPSRIRQGLEQSLELVELSHISVLTNIAWRA